MRHLTETGRLRVAQLAQAEFDRTLSEALALSERVVPESCDHNTQIVVSDRDGTARVARACVFAGFPGKGWDGLLCESVPMARQCCLFQARERPEDVRARLELDFREGRGTPTYRTLRDLLENDFDESPRRTWWRRLFDGRSDRPL